MQAKSFLKIGVDISMTVLFLCQMGYHLIGGAAHEWLGVALCLLFFLHHALPALPWSWTASLAEKTVHEA